MDQCGLLFYSLTKYIAVMRKTIFGIPESWLRPVSATLALLIIAELGWPTAAYALTGGPSQPEVQGFTPIGTSEMVNVFTGDFSYNIPLLDVDGYPVNIAYQSGAGMEDEASWVGLGWSLNVGTINRAMRGLPDEFKGETVTKKLNMRPSRTYGVKGTFTPELFGANIENSIWNFNVGAGFYFNNYNGFGFEKSLSMSMNTGKGGKGPLTAGLGLNSDTNNGLSIQPSVSLSSKDWDETNQSVVLGTSLGASYNTRTGLKQLTLSTSYSVSNTVQKVNEKNEVVSRSKGTSSGGTSSSFNLGVPTYTPSVSMSMKNLSVSGRFTTGGELFGAHGLVGINAYYSSQELKDESISNPAYGYFYTGHGQSSSNGLHDFNREKDGAFIPSTPVLPVTNYTYDVFSVAGQGTGGSFRPFRNNVGHVYDAASGSESDGYSAGFETGFGNTNHTGGEISVNSVNTISGKWTDGNSALTKFSAVQDQIGSLEESFYFREANELGVSSEPEWIASLGGFDPIEFKVNQSGNFNTTLSSTLAGSSGTYPISTTKRNKREHRNSVLSMLTNSEVTGGLGFKGTNYNSLGYTSSLPAYHPAEFTALGNDGSRYIYAIPALNHKTIETTFAVGQNINGQSGPSPQCTFNGVNVQYSSTDKSMSNARGLDNYFTETETPAYAHAYLLSAIVSQDYIDSDNTPGPSLEDMGTYTVFNYQKTSSAYKWRSPIGSNTAQYVEGVRVDKTDDKANVVYGEKEIWFLSSIQTKNYVAVFVTSPRNDARPVNGPDGGVNFSTPNNNPMHKLDRIELYTRAGYLASEPPIKSIIFEYDYSLCQDLPNSGLTSPGGGKLTLKAIYMTYVKSDMGAIHPYRFSYANSYSGGTFTYDRRDIDRWGNFKPDLSSSCNDLFGPLPNSAFPYCEQGMATDEYAQAWLLNRITLPSGGEIEVEYESDDYAFVQNKRAMQMAPIVGVITGSNQPLAPSNGIVPIDSETKYLFDLNGYNSSDYLNGIGQIVYMRCEVNIPPTFGLPDTYNDFESIPVYAQRKIYDSGQISVDLNGDGNFQNYGYVQLEGVHPKVASSGWMSPIMKSAIQFGRLNAPQVIYNENGNLPDFANGSLGVQLLESFLTFIATNNLSAIFTDPNTDRSLKQCGRYFKLNRSFIRVFNPDGHKRGGGARVKSVKIHDMWDSMSNSSAPGRTFGQQYSYLLENGQSSGVAAYEPQIGGDENPFRMPLAYVLDNMFALDESRFIEEPIGESFFPSPQVGYSRVVITDYVPYGEPSNGRVVQEFFTAKDFPTIVRNTSLANPIRQRSNPAGISSLLNIDAKDYMTASQGFSIETNDMHGKQRAQYVYAGSSQNVPISSVVYEYASEGYQGALRLKNDASVIDSEGNVSTGMIGVHFDMIADFRESISTVEGSGVQGNVESFVLPLVVPVPVVAPIPIPSYSLEKTRFRSATLTKVIQRFGLLARTIATDNTSVVSTRNLAYDAVTGQVLVTETVNNFDDKVFNLTYPVHWYYEQMGPSFKNIGFTNNLSFNSAGFASFANANNYYVEGDVIGSANYGLGWVTNVNAQGIIVQRKNGSPFVGTHTVKVLQSGRKNLSTQSMAQVTTLLDPLDYFTSNVFEKVIQASAVEYSDKWSTYCDCYSKDGLNFTTSNPYVLGVKGNWKPVKSYAYLAGREQSYYNYNTNIKKDGVFTSYSPFYRNSNGNWGIDKANWTFASEVSEFSPFGQELENRDALGRYSAAQFGYRGLIPVAVAANARYFQIGFNNFEDQLPNFCGQSLRFGGGAVVNGGHTGNKSIRVTNGQSVAFSLKGTTWPDCEEKDCGLSLQQTGAGNPYFLSPVGASGPINYSYQIIYGTPGISIGAGNVIKISGSAYMVIFTVTDSSGCSVSYQLQF